MGIQQISIFVVGFVFSFVSSSAAASITFQNLTHDRLYYLQKESGRRSVFSSLYMAKQKTPAGLMIKACKISEKKFPHFAKSVSKFRNSLQEQLKGQQAKKRKIASDFLALSRKAVDERRPPLRFDCYKPAVEFIENATRNQREWIRNGLSNLDENVRKNVEREYLRYLIVEVGLLAALGEPELSNTIGISEDQLNLLWKSQRKQKQNIENQAANQGRVQLNKVFSILNRNQISKIERRLGMKKEDIPFFVDNFGIDHLVKKLRCDQVFYVDQLGKRKKYVGIGGLNEISKSLPANLRVKYHVTEMNPRKTKLSKKIHHVYYSSIIKNKTPINTLERNAILNGNAGGEYQQRSSLWSFEASPKQSKGVSLIVSKWEKAYKAANSLEKKIQENNELLEELDGVMISGQGIRVFRAFFQGSGPVGFFFLPGVKEEYQLSQNQLTKLEKQGKQSANTLLNDRRNEWINNEREAISTYLSKKQIKKLETLVGLPLNRIVEDRYEFCEKIRLYPLYMIPKAGEKSLRKLKVTMIDPRIRANLSVN